MTNTITYFSQNAINPNEVWAAYVLLPTCNRWNVVAFGATEEEAQQKIIALYENERKSVPSLYTQMDAVAAYKAESNHHFAGKVWMIHSFSRAKQRINPDEVTKYEADGWVRGGPRSK